ncbi:insulinase family protein [Candidatus Saccharibacteria bacterium]|jgi:predicted Zn-dependent peptidase|nr:insulinase family protein [Candidatus Saccharibacteria bacterium]
MTHSVTEVSLKNGAKGLLVHVPDATVMDFEFNFRAGEYLVPREKWEVPHLMEHVLLGANQMIPKARAFQAEFEKNGAANNASTGLYYITYEAEAADFEWKRILELMLVAISMPLFLRDEFKAEFGNVRDELSARSNNHFRTLSLTAREAHGLLGMTDRERLKQMKNVRKKDLEDHYKNTHTTDNLRFVIAGNLKNRRGKIKQILETIQLPKGKGLFELPDEKPKNLEQPVFVARPSVKNVYFDLQTFAHRRFDDSDMDALELVNGMLTATLYSRILGEARERGLVYSMGSGVDTMKNSTGWWFSAQVLTRNAPALFEIIVRELQRVKEGDISESDLESAKMYWLGRHQRGAQTVSGTMSGYTGRYYFDEVINDYDSIPDRIKAVTCERIVENTNAMFSEGIGGLAVLGGGSRSRELANRLYEQVQPLWNN